MVLVPIAGRQTYGCYSTRSARTVECAVSWGLQGCLQRPHVWVGDRHDCCAAKS